MAMCVMAVVAVAPCQCFSPGGNQITSPGRISSIGPSQRCASPQPAVTISVWPSGCVCHAVRAPGSNVTLAPAARAGAFAWNNGSMRTVPVNQSAGPLLDGCEPIFLISMCFYQLRKGAWLRRSFTLSTLSILNFSLEHLFNRPEQDLVHVHFFRLAHRKDNSLSKRLGRNRDLVIVRADLLGDVWLGHAIRKFRRHRARRDDCCANVIGFNFLSKSFGERAHGMLGRRIDREIGT